ncbi:right-handed parallel beta-helix repeat-containing protein [Methanobrevibacter sp.]|uniref:right-handed parallel beta-helix repeat-containing protein n=1 Tax=Methanobrevibacter sp. TaxID=66852 RepID=UPI003890333D
MNKKGFMIILLVFVLFTLNFSVAQEIDNSTDDTLQIDTVDSQILETSNSSLLKASPKVSTHLDVESDTTFDVVGDYFKVMLSDDDNNTIKNAKVTFKVNGKTYSKNTNSKGIASLQLRLADGTYKIVTKFAGDSKYKAASLTTNVTIDNTRVVDSGLSNAEIQSIIDNAKVNNVILFKGKSYSDINLVITKSVSLLSNVGTTLKSSSTNPVITIKGNGASLTSIKGFNIQGNGDGINVNGADYVTINNNEITTKGNAIVGLNTKYLNITKNDIVKNSKSGISIAESSYAYIFNNNINSNGLNGIELAKSNNIYIHGNTLSKNNNAIYLAKKINGVDYKLGPSDIHINKNTITKSKNDGILMFYAGDNVNIKANSIESNYENGISMAHVGSNTIQSNIISENGIGVKFFDDYVKPKNQTINYNAVVGNDYKDMEAKETYYQENGVQLDVGDNWYGDLNLLCPKINSGKIKFKVTQIGDNLFQATFTDSDGNIASLLPDRTLTYKTNNGKTISVDITGGAGVFTADANDGDLVRATVDLSNRDNIYDSNSKSVQPVNGQAQTFSYPTIPSYQLYGDLGTGNGAGTGEGNGGDNNQGNGNSQQGSRDNTGNGTHSQNNDPSKNANNPVNQVSQPESAQTTSQASASDAGQSSADPGSQSVVKQIIIDDDEFFKVTGISFIILLIILTIGLYYREDIKEMKSKM